MRKSKSGIRLTGMANRRPKNEMLIHLARSPLPSPRPLAGEGDKVSLCEFNDNTELAEDRMDYGIE